MLSKHLFHFAMVHEEFAKTGDIVKGLLPLFTPILSNKEGEDFLPEKFSRDVNAAYGIDMHPYVAEGLAPKLVEAGILRESESAKRKSTYIIDSVPNIDSAKIQNDTSLIFKEFEKLTVQILKNANLLHANIDFPKEFTSRLARLDPSPEKINLLPNGKSKIIDAIDYSFVRFIQLIEKKGGPIKDALEKVYSGSILAEVVLSIKEPSIDESAIKGKNFYIDAPIILNLLGLNDEYSVKCSLKLIEQIKQNGGILTTTSSYLDEAQTAIKLALENHLNRGPRYTTLDFFLFKGSNNLLTARTAQNNIKKILIDHQFHLDNNLINISSHISSQKANSLKDKIINELNWYKNDLAKYHDAEAITHVVANHGYCSIKKMSDSKSFLVTPNESLISSSNKVLYSTQAFIKPEMTPLLSEKNLAMLLWVISGGSGENISSLTLISSCTRAMEMHKDVFYKIQSFLKNLPKEKISLYEDIICIDRALYCLIDEVGANYNAINDSNFEDHLITARQKFEQQEREENEAKKLEIESLSKKYEKSEANKQKAITALINASTAEMESEKKRGALDEKIKDLHEKITEIGKNSEEERKKHDEDIAQLKKEYQITTEEKINQKSSFIETKISNILEVIFKLLLSIILAFATYKCSTIVIQGPYKNDYFQINENLLRFLIVLIPLITTWTLPDILFGKAIKHLSKKISNRIIN